MKVRAIQKGYYGNKRRRVGDIFSLTEGTQILKKDGVVQLKDHKPIRVKLSVDQQFSGKWMEKVEGEKAPAPKKAAVKKPERPSGDEDVLST